MGWESAVFIKGVEPFDSSTNTIATGNELTVDENHAKMFHDEIGKADDDHSGKDHGDGGDHGKTQQLLAATLAIVQVQIQSSVEASIQRMVQQPRLDLHKNSQDLVPAMDAATNKTRVKSME